MDVLTTLMIIGVATVVGETAIREDHVRDLQERLDFAERRLTQAQERSALGPGARQRSGPA